MHWFEYAKVHSVRKLDLEGYEMEPANQAIVEASLEHLGSRYGLWSELLTQLSAKRVVEIGVFRGNFAAEMLQRCSFIERYYMLDPWRHLQDWNKPSNKSDDDFERIFSEARAKTDFAATRRIILRGRTTEVIDRIQDDELDFAYIDGDHTLRGIAIDLIRVFPKVRPGGWVGGDDFSRSIWQHGRAAYEPNLVFPFAVHFAEAMEVPIYAMPRGQFLIDKTPAKKFAFHDLTDMYDNLTLKDQLRPGELVRLGFRETSLAFRKNAKRLAGLVGLSRRN